MLKNKIFYKNDVSDKILMVLPRASDKVLNNLKGLPLCELITFETTPFGLTAAGRSVIRSAGHIVWTKTGPVNSIT